jgi:hypothetical protein
MADDEKVIPTDDDDDAGVDPGTTGGDDDDDEGETPAPQPKAKPKSRRPARKADGDDTVSVSVSKYNKALERLREFEEADRQRREAEQRKAKETVDKIAEKDWPKARKQLEANHRREVEERDKKLSVYENRIKSQVASASVRAGIASFHEKNPSMRLKDEGMPFIEAEILKRIRIEWDDEAGEDGAGDFVAIDPETGREAADVIREWLADDRFRVFREAGPKGSGARTGGFRPAPAKAEGPEGKTVDRFAEVYNKSVMARQTPSEGFRPSIGLRPQSTRTNGSS